MKAAAILISLVLILGLFVVGCAKQETTDNPQPNAEQGIEPVTETAQYIDAQLVNPDETVEIGEMI